MKLHVALEWDIGQNVEVMTVTDMSTGGVYHLTFSTTEPEVIYETYSKSLGEVVLICLHGLRGYLHVVEHAL